ncbi:MAG: site-specific integrase [Candidatus Acididesulfobacter guangdongensis]|uniref:Site-specific integrase n=1 Tax=Acididesulfobacter guangdongensis TaxID=2597225 RepID=A0A519BE91_ACIG2|nr:MAG: site-specific integrase [Candidatus Acididesulfobacter guangdongensis]
MLIKEGENYCYSFEVNGIHYSGSCGTADENTAILVEQLIKSATPAKSSQKLINLKELWEEYLSSSSALLSTATVERKKNALKHVFKFFKDIQVSEIDSVMIEKYLSFRKKEILERSSNTGKREQEISFRTANIELAVLSNLLNFAVRRGYIEKNATSGIKKLNELSRLKTLSDSDIEKLINGATNKLTRDLITFLIYTGCRKGEALNLKWDDVDLKNDVIAIKGTKTKYDRYIPVSRALKRILEEINREYVYVFSYRGKKLSNFRESFKTACKRAGLNGLRVHDLRHVFASKMVMSGTSLYITGELLGHRTPQMTMRYAHLAPYTLKKAVDEVWG